MWHVEGTEKLHTEFWWGESREGYHYEDVGYRVLVGRTQGNVPLWRRGIQRFGGESPRKGTTMKTWDTEFWWGEPREGYHYEDVGYRDLVRTAQGRVPLWRRGIQNFGGESPGKGTTMKTWDTEFWLGESREGYHYEDVGADMKKILKWIFNKRDGEPWTGLLWLRVKTGGDGRFLMR